MPDFPVGHFLEMQIRKLQEKSKPYQAMSNNASAVGHPCVRYLVLKRTRGDEADPISAELAAVFAEGETQEAVAIDIIKSLGFHYERGQESFGIKDLQVRGKIDGVTILRGANGRPAGRWASEIKSTQEFTYEKLNSVEDLKGNWWHYKWLVQVMLAIYHVSEKEGFDDTGVLWLKNKNCRMVKPISVPLDMSVLDETFKKCAAVNAHISANTLPERLPYTRGVCQGCEFKRICQPEEVFLAGSKIDDQDFIKMLTRRETLEQSSKEYDRLDKQVKDVLRGKEYAVAGPFRITGKKHGNGWKVDIERVMSDADAAVVAGLSGTPAPAVQLTPAAEDIMAAIDAAKTLDALENVRVQVGDLATKGMLTESDKAALGAAFKSARKQCREQEKVGAAQ